MIYCCCTTDRLGGVELAQLEARLVPGDVAQEGAGGRHQDLQVEHLAQPPVEARAAGKEERPGAVAQLAVLYLVRPPCPQRNVNRAD